MEEPNGLTKGRASARLGNGKATLPLRRHGVQRTRSWRSRLFNTIARLLTWYAIITILFRCPPTLDECDDTSPVLCKAYFNTRDVVVPHVEPYYDAYAAPYVDKVRPYVDTVSTRVIAPTRVVLERYAAPKLQQAKDFAQAHWATTGQPQVDKAREFVTENYEQKVAPHVEKVSEALGPYREIAQTNAMETYHDVILPGYEFVKPYAVSAYDTGCTVTTETVVPSVVFAFNKTRVFLDGNVWPHLRAVYDQSVEPQLVRIGERLGRYKESGSNGATKKSVPSSQSSADADAEPSSFVKPSESVKPSEATDKKDATTSATKSETVSSADASVSSADESDVEEVAKKPSRDEVRRIAAETVAEDLNQWETKFATAAEEGASDIEEKVNELSAAMFKSGVEGQGKKLMQELKRLTEEQVEALKQEIISVVESSASDTTTAKEATVAAVRAAGLAIKEKAEQIRSWREEFELELRSTVTSKAQEHFNILGNMRDLALQKLGMKWAWMDGVTYKDWAQYHEMKNKFDDWTQELQQLIVTNPRLEAAMNGAADVEDQAMEIAQAAAVQLGLLKQVAAWKIDAGDASDNFDPEEMEQAAETALAAAAEAERNAEETPDVNESQEDKVPEPLASDGSSTEGEEEVHADTAPEVEPEEEPEPEEGEGIHTGSAKENINPADPVEAEPDLNEENEEAESQLESETPAVHEENPADSEAEPSIESTNAEADIGQEEEAPAPSVEDSADNEAVVGQKEPESVILGAAAQLVLPEEATASAAEAAEKATSAAESLYSDVLAEASAELSSARSSVSEKLVATPEVDAEELISGASEAYSASVESADSELSRAVEAVESAMEGVLDGAEPVTGETEENVAVELEPETAEAETGAAGEEAETPAAEPEVVGGAEETPQEGEAKAASADESHLQEEEDDDDAQEADEHERDEL